MAFLCTLATLRPLVRSQAGVQRIRFIDDADLNPWIVNAWTRLYDIFVEGGDPYFEKDKDLTLKVAGELALPADFMVLRRVSPLVGDLVSGELVDLDIHEAATEQGDASGAGTRGYRLRACELQLPGSSAGQKVRVTYVPTPTEPKDGSGAYLDTVAMDCVKISGREWVVLQAAIRCLEKQKESTAALEASARALHAELGARARRRTASVLRRVAEVVSFDDPYLTGRVPRARR